MPNPPPIPQIDLDEQGGAWRMDALTPTTGEVLGADVTEAAKGMSEPLANMYYGASASLGNTPIRYTNAVDYAEKLYRNYTNPGSVPFDNPQLTAEEANAKYWQPGMNKFSTPIHEQAAEILSSRQQDLNNASQKIAQANLGFKMGLVNDFGTMALNMLDPSQDVMYLTPMVGEEAVYARVAKGLGDSFFGRTGAALVESAGEILRGSVEGNLVNYVTQSPFGQQSSLEDYAKEDLEGMVAPLALGIIGHSFAESFKRGTDFFSELHPTTQEHLTNALSSNAPADLNKVLDLDQNINEVEAQLNTGKQSIEDRVKMMADPDRPKTSQELREAGEDDKALAVEQAGQSSVADRAVQVKQEFDSGQLDVPESPKPPEEKPLVEPEAPVSEQAVVANKLLTDTNQAHADLVKQLEQDPEKNEKQINDLNDMSEKADEEINRVKDQKSYTEAAINCALNNGL